MGKQVSKVLRRKAKQLYELHKDKFSSDFEQNKKALEELNIAMTKIDKNILAGVLVKLAEVKTL
jgi:ribosomal protein S17E